MKPEDKLPKEIEWTMPDGRIEIVTREELLQGFKIGATKVRELMRDREENESKTSRINSNKNGQKDNAY